MSANEIKIKIKICLVKLSGIWCNKQKIFWTFFLNSTKNFFILIALRIKGDDEFTGYFSADSSDKIDNSSEILHLIFIFFNVRNACKIYDLIFPLFSHNFPFDVLS